MDMVSVLYNYRAYLNALSVPRTVSYQVQRPASAHQKESFVTLQGWRRIAIVKKMAYSGEISQDKK